MNDLKKNREILIMTSLLARNQSANNDKINRQSAIGLSVDVAGGGLKNPAHLLINIQMKI